MKQKGWLLLWAVAMVAVMVIFSIIFWGSSSKQASQKEQPAKKVIKIGAILPLTGDISEYGQRCKKGVDLALEELNQDSQLSVTVIYEDSEGSPQKGVAVAHKLINTDRVRFIIGDVSSSVTLSILPITEASQILLFSPAASSPKLSGISPLFLRDWPSDVLEATVLANYAAETLKLKTVLVLYVNNDYGLGLKNEFAKTFAKKGGRILSEEGYPQNARDFRSIVTKYGPHFRGPLAVYLAGYHKEMALATKQLREGGFKGQILGDADYGIPELVAIAGQAAEGAIYATPWYNPESNEIARNFANKMKQKYGTSPSEFEGNGYDALKLIVDGIRQKGEDSLAVVGQIRQLHHFPGAGGYLTFTPQGDVIKPIALMKVEGGKFIRLGTVELPTESKKGAE